MAISSGTWKVIGRAGLNQAIDVTSTTQKYPLGTRVKARDVGSTAYGEGEFIYLVGVASTVAGDAVVYNLTDGTTVRTVSASKGLMAIAMSANVASQYGWYQIQGLAVATHGTTAAAQGAVYTTATDGTLDGTQVDSQQVIGAFQCADDDTGKCKLSLQYPVAGTDDQLS